MGHSNDIGGVLEAILDFQFTLRRFSYSFRHCAFPHVFWRLPLNDLLMNVIEQIGQIGVGAFVRRF